MVNHVTIPQSENEMLAALEMMIETASADLREDTVILATGAVAW